MHMGCADEGQQGDRQSAGRILQEGPDAAEGLRCRAEGFCCCDSRAEGLGRCSGCNHAATGGTGGKEAIRQSANALRCWTLPGCSAVEVLQPDFIWLSAKTRASRAAGSPAKPALLVQAAGNRTMMRVPPSGDASMPMLPAWASTICRAMARPRPLPPVALLRDRSSR